MTARSASRWWASSGGGASPIRSPAAPPIATANEIRIPAGRPIVFTLQSADVIHSFWVPNLGGKMDMIPGRTTHLRLQADQPGVFRGQCAEYCGGPHALMALEVVAMPPAEFEAWLQGQARPAAEPASEAAERGRELFLAAGCGACHTVRGTAAAGTVGPDLTHLGSRRSVGIDTAADDGSQHRALHPRRPAHQARQSHAAVPHLHARRPRCGRGLPRRLEVRR